MEWWLATAALVGLALWLGRRLDRRRADPTDATLADEVAELEPIPIGDELDLHGVAGREIAGLVDEFVRSARQRGSRTITIVHGRGTGVLRRRVRSLLAGHEDVERYADATGRAGGATAVWLLPLAPRPPGH